MKQEASSSSNALAGPIRHLSFVVSNRHRYACHPPVVASAFSSGHQNDAPTRRFLFTVVVVIVIVIVVIVVVVVVVVPGAVNTNGCPAALLAVASQL